VDNVKAGMGLLQQASGLIQGGFTMDKLARGRALFEEAGSIFKRFQGGGQQQEEGVGEEVYATSCLAQCETQTDLYPSPNSTLSRTGNPSISL
jgi:hypothetical protein